MGKSLKIPVNNRTRVGLGSALFLDGRDPRSQLARRFREIFYGIVEDLGGLDRSSEAQRQLARRAAALSCVAEGLEAEMAAGSNANVGAFVTATNALRRVLVSLGLKRVARDVTPNLQAYLAAREGRAGSDTGKAPSSTRRRARIPTSPETLNNEEDATPIAEEEATLLNVKAPDTLLNVKAPARAAETINKEKDV